MLEIRRTALADRLAERVEALEAELVDFRRDLHAHPEVARTERRTTEKVADRLRQAGLSPTLLPGTGLVCDVGPGPVTTGRRRVALRADLDALPMTDECGEPWRSTVPGVAHACGHDVHTTVVLGAGLVLADLARDGDLDVGVRLIFQAAEEVQPGGALDAVEAGAMDGVGRVFALHCDPRLDVGRVGTRIGPITSASDAVTVSLTAPGGHTSRPHLTGDVVYALGQVITQVPVALARRMDPRSGVNLTWGEVRAGSAPNVIPTSGTVRGTLRCLESRAWEDTARVLREAVEHAVGPYEVEVELSHRRGVPPVENEDASTRMLDMAARDVIGPEAVTLTEQSLGGEDFAWLLTRAPGAMARLGTRTPGGRTYDIHQGDFRVDEGAIAVGAKVLARVAVLAGEPEKVPVP
ncbi:amidohydrolase [Cellulomonas bogoriensis]|uniref:N-acyl-L-amino acid amidohydrolase n=1 Tax=Cellulomonas bogoriensis 69B4 = DSM 16987 TaxID=1386082 RepID=A0A0A0BZI4_9CELL|nr:amidohydrolase [Cellulomonas bogoriensis]KGM13350.1 N-acyl-L-amino acid amidohydrolase [Cellulomonas bogoriensis 69B4 = DSM 16987]